MDPALLFGLALASLALAILVLLAVLLVFPATFAIVQVIVARTGVRQAYARWVDYWVAWQRRWSK